MTKHEREALKLALEALKRATNYDPVIARAITAIKEALAQPEQKPVAWMFQHEETGRMMFVETQQLEWGFEKGNPRLKKIGPLYTSPPQRKPLTDEDIWVLTSEYNDYDQHGEYFEAIFIGKPTSKQIQKHCHVTEQGAVHILNGGGRVKYGDQWYNLRKEKAAHGIKELKEYKK